MAATMVSTVRGVVGTVGILALIVCSTRLYIRKFVVRAFGLDDYFVIAALILALFFAALSIALTFYGIGQHEVNVPPEHIPTMEYLVYISLCTYLFVASTVKASLVLFMMRIFSTKFIRTFGTGILIFLFLFTISGELPLILQCTPVRAAYDTTLTASEKKCFSADILFDLEMYQGVLMFVIDIVIFAMPIPTIWNLQMPIQRRLVIVGVFGIGTVSCAAGLARLPTLVYQKNVSDFTYAGATPLIWMNVEYCLALVTGSLPSLRPLLRSIPGFSSSNKTNSKSHEWVRPSAQSRSSYKMTGQSRWTQKMLGKNHVDIETLATQNNESRERIVQD